MTGFFATSVVARNHKMLSLYMNHVLRRPSTSSAMSEDANPTALVSPEQPLDLAVPRHTLGPLGI